MISIAGPQIDNREIQAVKSVLISGALAHGKKVEEFEEAFAAYIGSRYAVAVSSGTAALYLALLAHGIGAGDEVITTPFTFIATANSILMTGAQPVFVDIDERTFNIDPDAIRKSISSKTRAIMPVHLYGQSCLMDEIMDIAQAENLVVVEDACQAHGAEYKGQKTGSFASGCFSFYPTKNMTTGEGGMITSNDPELVDKLRMLRNHGQKQRYNHLILGHNFRMTNIAAAIGLCQLAKLDNMNLQRRRNAQYLGEMLQGVKGTIIPHNLPAALHVFHQYTLRISQEYGVNRDILRQQLQAKGIGAEVYYPLPIHQQPCYLSQGYNQSLPKAEQAAREVLSLPVHPGLGEQEMEIIASCLEKCRK